MFPQERNSDTVPPYGYGCAAACLQANIDWITGNRQDQDVFWGFMRDRQCREFGGQDALLPITSEHPSYGDHGWEIRRLNIAYDFGADPHAVAWAMWFFASASYHNYIYDGVWLATEKMLWTIEHYQEPVMAAVREGSHWVSVTGYEANAPATDPGFSTVYSIRYSDPLPTNNRDNWVHFDTWKGYFTRYTNSLDPDPSVGGYVPPPRHWHLRWVTVQRDTADTYNPDWTMTYIREGSGYYVLVPVPKHWRVFAPLIEKYRQ